MTRLLICTPLGIEARAIRRGLPAGPPDTVVVRTGFGARRSARRVDATPALIGRCDALAVAGFGGALDRTLRPGDVLVATEVRFGDRLLRCAAPELLAGELTHAGVRARTGPLLTAGHLVREAERRALARGGARAVDMEAGPLVAAATGRPFTVVRAIVDTPGRPLVSPCSVSGGLAARRALRRVGPALVRWSEAVTSADESPVAPRREGRS
jgi:4-hydroxy-3-methylbut-2-enyl diphosphate reductase